jgi:lactate racemase
MIVKLARGHSDLPVDLRGLTVRHLKPTAPVGARDVGTLVGEALDQPLDGPPLEVQVRGAASATVIVPDATRHVGLPEVLPVVLSRLEAAGVDRRRTTVLVACGTHPAVPDAEVSALTGSLPNGVRVVQHDARDDAGLVTAGELEPGVPIRIARVVAEAEVVVTVGTVRHHYFAGFGGGPKMIFPGTAGYAEIQRNHSRVMMPNAEGLPAELDVRCAPGRLAGNPVAEEISHAADLAPPTLALCLVPGTDGRPAWAGAGSWRIAFAAAVERVREWFEVECEPHHLVVASGGGNPSDATLIQAHKGLDAACRFAAPGAEVLFVAALERGLGSEDMVPFVDDPRPEVIRARLSQRWVQYGHTTLRILDKTGRFKVHLYSGLDPELARRLGFHPLPDPSQVIEGWREEFPREAVAVIPGGAVFPRSS